MELEWTYIIFNSDNNVSIIGNWYNTREEASNKANMELKDIKNGHILLADEISINELTK